MSHAQKIKGLLRRVPIWALYLVAVAPPVWYFYLGLSGQLGADPVKAMEWKIGRLGLTMLVISLAVSPMRRFTGVSLIRFRRAISLIGFGYIFLHLLVWLVLDVQIVSQIWGDILKRPFVTIGMAAFVLMIPLALTSNNWSMRRLGAVRWRALHRLTYLVLLLGGVHYLLVGKVWLPRAMIYLSVIIVLLLLRVNFRKLLRALPGGKVGTVGGR